MVDYKNTDGVRTIPMNEGNVIQELTAGSPDYGAIKVGTDGTYAGEVRIAKKSEITPLYHSQPVSINTLEVSNLVKTPTQVAVTYTGNGTSQGIVTNMSTIDFTASSNGTGYYLDRATNQVKNDAGVVQDSGHIDFANISGIDGVSKVHIKSRSAVAQHAVYDGLRGKFYEINTDDTNIESVHPAGVYFKSNGFGISGHQLINSDTKTYIAYQTLYTNIKWSYSNHGKLIVEAYNPQSLDTMIYYEGSGINGHELSHSLGRMLSFGTMKNLSNNASHIVYYGNNDSYLLLNSTNSKTIDDDTFNSTDTFMGIGGVVDDLAYNDNGNYYILYGFANAYYNEDGKLIGNKECGTYIGNGDGTGAYTQIVKTRAKPAEVVVKAISTTGNWWKQDNQRDNKDIKLNVPDAEGNYVVANIINNGVSMIDNLGTNNMLSEQYLYIVSYDTKLNGGGAYQDIPSDTSAINVDMNVNVINGADSDGVKSSIVTLDGTIDTSSVTESGTYYIAVDNGGI